MIRGPGFVFDIGKKNNVKNRLKMRILFVILLGDQGNERSIRSEENREKK